MELLSPAGNLEKIKYAIIYGADAVYAGSHDFSLRAKADNFTVQDLQQAVEFCHVHQKKLYVPLNIYAHNRHIEGIKSYIKVLEKAKIDAVIVSDIGVLDLVKSISPDLTIHVSTQANVTSFQSVKAYQKLGAKRVILARELSFHEIKEIREKCPDIELEIFVHGAMCVSYSGRCLLSMYLNNRSANLGECTQPCRWKYSLTEESRPQQNFPIFEDQNGSFIMNSKDLCLFDRLSDIYNLGIDSIKIEGRMKSLYYVATVTRAYKQAIASIKGNSKVDLSYFRAELEKISHRVYTQGFFSEEKDLQNYETAQYVRDWQFVGNITKIQDEYATVRSYHKITPQEEIEIIFPEHDYDLKISKPNLYNMEMEELEFTKPNSCFILKLPKALPDFGIIRSYKV